MHPEAIGRGYCMQMLERIVAAMRDRGRPWFATHAQIAALASQDAAADPALFRDVPDQDQLDATYGALRRQTRELVRG